MRKALMGWVLCDLMHQQTVQTERHAGSWLAVRSSDGPVSPHAAVPVESVGGEGHYCVPSNYWCLPQPHNLGQQPTLSG